VRALAEGWRARACALLGALGGCGLWGLGQGAVPLPPGGAGVFGSQLLQYVEAQAGDGHTDVSAQFACTVIYLGNTPLNHGSSTLIRLRLGADCTGFLGALTPELPLVGGSGELVTGARLESVVPGEVMLELRFARELDFVIAPSSDGRGLRLRLLSGTRGKQSGGYVAEVEAPEGYAINLSSSQQKIDPQAVQAAASALGAPAYVSETDVEGEHWYRLRVGPFSTRREAQRVLQAALGQYPRAWLAINDESADLAATERASVASVAASGAVDAELPQEQRVQLLRDARAALAQRQYAQAVELLTHLLRQGEYAGREQAQELIGLVRERAGQLAHAKAEYEEYLRRYPQGPAAERVRARLLALAAASQSVPSSGEFAQPAPHSQWSMAGSASVGYQYGLDQLGSGPGSTSSTSLNAALLYGDLLVRDHGPRYEFTGRVDSGYTANFVPNTGGSQDQTTAAYVQIDDRTLGWSARAGRQSLANEGSIGLFDGLYVGYQLNPKISLSAAAGFPAYTNYSAVSSNQKFGTVQAEFGPYRGAWIFDGYFYDELNAGATERRSVGFETRYSMPGRSAMLLADYDVDFQQLNSATLIGNLGTAEHWIVGFYADHRRSPLLELSNALLGQNAPDLAVLETEFTPSQIRQLALDRTATSNSLTLSATHALGARWQFITDLSALELSGTPASGGVAATASTGLDKTISLQLSGSSLWQAGDLHFFGLRYDNSPESRSTTLSWDARFVLHGAWRFGPRFSIEQLSDPALGGSQWLYLPELRGDWTGRRGVFELIGGYQVQQQSPLAGQLPASTQDARHLYVSAAYRLRF
jgi:tetratricopeptide (TPR) repeat protein